MYGTDDDHANERGDKAIFDRGYPGIIGQE
jgi:hypothetical protein